MLDDPLPRDTILNVNVPDLPPEALGSVRATRLGFRHKSEPVIKALDPKNQPIYWVGPAGAGQDAGPGTDFYAIGQGQVSVTPIKIDLTNRDQLPELATWLERRRR
jgi:5'-nucleotidase